MKNIKVLVIVCVPTPAYFATFVTGRFNKTDASNLFVRPDFEGLGHLQVATNGHTSQSWVDAPRNSFGQRTTGGGVPLPEAFYFPACYRSLGQWTWGHTLADSAFNNTCILNATTSPYIFGACNPASPESAGNVPLSSFNTFLTPGGALEIACGGRTLSLQEAQAVGFENGSSTGPTPGIAATVVLIHEWLLF